MFKWQQDILCVEAAFLYNKSMYDGLVKLKKQIKGFQKNTDKESLEIAKMELKVANHKYKKHPETFLPKSAYDTKRNRKKLKPIINGGNGRTALIKWSSLGDDLREKIIAYVGYNPEDNAPKNTFESRIKYDAAAVDFFKYYLKSNGEPLSAKQQLRYTTNAQVFNAISQIIKERELSKTTFGKSDTKLWKNISEAVANLNKEEFPHDLPKHYRRLRPKYEKYNDFQYIALIHGGTDNTNSQKIKDEVADWRLAKYSLPNKLMVPIIMREYDRIRLSKGWPELTDRVVNKWLQTTEVKRIWVLARHGVEEYKRLYGHYIKRDRSNWFPNAYWAIDGSKIDWLHYEDNARGFAGSLKIDPVVDVFSEKIIGWSYSETENHIDHFTAIKMACKTAGCRPYLMTYDNQSGHKMAEMQELYDGLVARDGGTHYPNKAKSHNSPVENIFKRLQQQVINNFWFSDGQSPTVRDINNKPNWEFLQEFKHEFKSKEELLRAWELCVKMWNEAEHPKFKSTATKKGKSRNEVYAMEQPMSEEMDVMDMVDLFWIYKKSTIEYRRGGIDVYITKNKEMQMYQYEVLDSQGRIDLDFRKKYIGSKFIVKYDPDQMDTFVQLFKVDENGSKTLIANAEPKRAHESVPVLMKEGDKEAWKQDYDVAQAELERDLAEINALRMRTGITPEKLIEEQELMLKMGGILPKQERVNLESDYLNGF